MTLANLLVSFKIELASTYSNMVVFESKPYKEITMVILNHDEKNEKMETYIISLGTVSELTLGRVAPYAEGGGKPQPNIHRQ